MPSTLDNKELSETENPAKTEAAAERLAARWFAVQARCRYENLVAASLAHKGYQHFLPVYKRRSRTRRTHRDPYAPLFPGYLFCRFDPARRLPILTTPGVIRVVGFGNTPIPVEDAEINAIQRICHDDISTQPCSFVQGGERVRIVEGPLSDVEGIVVRLKNELRLIVSISLLRRSVAVEIERHCVRQI